MAMIYDRIEKEAVQWRDIPAKHVIEALENGGESRYICQFCGSPIRFFKVNGYTKHDCNCSCNK